MEEAHYFSHPPSQQYSVLDTHKKGKKWQVTFLMSTLLSTKWRFAISPVKYVTSQDKDFSRRNPSDYASTFETDKAHLFIYHPRFRSELQNHAASQPRSLIKYNNKCFLADRKYSCYRDKLFATVPYLNFMCNIRISAVYLSMLALKDINTRKLK